MTCNPGNERAESFDMRNHARPIPRLRRPQPCSSLRCTQKASFGLITRTSMGPPTVFGRGWKRMASIVERTAKDTEIYGILQGKEMPRDLKVGQLTGRFALGRERTDRLDQTGQDVCLTSPGGAWLIRGIEAFRPDSGPPVRAILAAPVAPRPAYSLPHGIGYRVAGRIRRK